MLEQPQPALLDREQAELMQGMAQVQQFQQGFAPRLAQALDLQAHLKMPPDPTKRMTKLMIAMRRRGGRLPGIM